jgi:hypothetical protein
VALDGLDALDDVVVAPLARACHMWVRVLPAGTTSNLFEENLEIVGHMLFLVLVVASIFIDVAPLAASRDR